MLFLGALGLVVVGIHQTNRALDVYRHPMSAPGQVGPLPDGKTLRILSLGFERLVADLFWLRTVYYIGDKEAGEAGFPDVKRLADLVTDIDPYFQGVYVNVDSILTVLAPRPHEAIELMDKGIRYIPDYWRMYFLQGYNYYNFLGDFETAGDLMTQASERGGPDWLPLLATRLYSHAGKTGTAIAFLTARIEEEQSDPVREVLESRLRDLLVHRDLKRIDRAIRRYTKKRGGPPSNVEALVRTGHLAELPRDPDGNRYEIRDGRAWTSLSVEPLIVHGMEEPE
jgi:hypothetical protein